MRGGCFASSFFILMSCAVSFSSAFAACQETNPNISLGVALDSSNSMHLDSAASYSVNKGHSIFMLSVVSTPTIEEQQGCLQIKSLKVEIRVASVLPENPYEKGSCQYTIFNSHMLSHFGKREAYFSSDNLGSLTRLYQAQVKEKLGLSVEQRDLLNKNIKAINDRFTIVLANKLEDAEFDGLDKDNILETGLRQCANEQPK